MEIRKDLNMLVEKFLPRNVLKIGYTIIAVWLILGSLIFGVWPTLVGYRKFKNSEYHSRIDSIEFREGHHGAPHVKLETGWYLLGAEELKITGDLRVNDSIVKIRGSMTISVYRKEADGSLTHIDFE